MIGSSHLQRSEHDPHRNKSFAGSLARPGCFASTTVLPLLLQRLPRIAKSWPQQFNRLTNHSKILFIRHVWESTNVPQEINVMIEPQKLLKPSMMLKAQQYSRTFCVPKVLDISLRYVLSFLLRRELDVVRFYFLALPAPGTLRLAS